MVEMPKCGCAYGVNFEVPWLTRLIEINDNLFIRQSKLFQYDMSAMCPRTAVIGVQRDLRRITVNLSHLGLTSQGIRDARQQ